MDILLTCFPDHKRGILENFDAIIKDISHEHTLISGINSMVNYLWKTKKGESIQISTDSFEIWFDGYVHSTGSDDLSTFLVTLAHRIVDEGKVLLGEESGIFNIIIIDKIKNQIILANDPGGLFPLFYSVRNNNFYASTHLHLFAKALNAKPDFINLISKVMYDYAIGPYTYYEDVRRLLPGELITFDPKSEIVQSRIKHNYFEAYYDSKKDIIERIRTALEAPIKKIISSAPDVGVMLSEGFDSRLISETLKQQGANVFSYTHGTSGTKGVRVTEKIAAKLALNHHFEEVIFPSDHNQIRRQLILSGNLHIPYWHRGNAYFDKMDVDVVTAGTALDSTLGGHVFYKSSSDRSKAIFQRIQEIFCQNFGCIPDEYVENLLLGLINEFNRIDVNKLSQRIKQRFVPEIANLLMGRIDQFRDCIKSEFTRIQETGSVLPSLQLQRFFLEHRARRFSFGQELTLRMNNRVVVPSYEIAFLNEVVKIPVKYKLNHGLYLRLLRDFYPKSTSIHTGNYLLPAYFPRIILEGSRFMGKYNDLQIIKRFLESRGQTNFYGYRGAHLQDLNGHDQEVFNYFYEFINKNNTIINADFFKNYLKKVENYQARTFNFDEFYSAIEICQIFQHTF